VAPRLATGRDRVRENGESGSIVRGRHRLVRFRDSRRRCQFDYTAHIEHVIRCWCQLYPQLQHIDMDRVAVSVVKCRSPRAEAPYATIASLRYPNGPALETGRRRIWPMPAVMKNEKEALYHLRIFLPRFHDLSGEEKVAAILRELHRIHPKFNGELRDSGRKRWAHSPARRTFGVTFDSVVYDIHARCCAVYELFLNCSFETLLERFGSIYGNCYRITPCAADRVQTVA